MDLLGEPKTAFTCVSTWKGKPRLQIFLVWEDWDGCPKNMEPDKCDVFVWMGVRESLQMDLTEHARKFIEWVLDGTRPVSGAR